MNILKNKLKKRRNNLFFLLCSLLTPSLYSCKDSLKKEEFNLNIVVAKDYSDNQDKVFPPELRNICSYYRDSVNCPKTIYFPKISINRPDLKQSSIIEIPLDAGDKIRQSAGLLSAKKLKGVYDKAMKDLQPPSFLFLKPVNKFTERELKKEYPNAIFCIPSTHYNVDSFKQSIAQKMCLSKSNSDITIVILNSLNSDLPSEVETADSAIATVKPTYPANGVIVKGEYLCDNKIFTKYEKVHDGKGGFKKGKILLMNSKECGYQKPIGQWISASPNKCEGGILYKFEKNTQNGLKRKIKVGKCEQKPPIGTGEKQLPRLLEENLTIEESKGKTKNIVKPNEAKKQ